MHVLTDLDAILVRSIWRLLRNPGYLTHSWTEGVRKSYVGPLQLLLTANVLFFGVQSLTVENIFSTTLASHLHHQDWSNLAGMLVQRRLELTGETVDLFSSKFDRAVVIYAKSLIVLMAIPFSLIAMLLFRRTNRPFLTNIVFAVHTYAFLLLLFCVALAIAALSRTVAGRGLSDPGIDTAISLALVLISGIYFYYSIPRVYAVDGKWRILSAVTLAVAAASIAIGYRFVVFLVTLYTT